MMPKQVDLFLNPIPLCDYCGYPMLPLKNWMCWYSYNKTLKDFNPFRVHWHEDLDRMSKFQERFAPQILEAANKALEERPRLLLEIEASRNESWVKSHALKLRKEVSQVSLIGYIIGGARARETMEEISSYLGYVHPSADKGVS
jgi:hypothetical protein